jgi:hypothetical protein
MCREKTSTEGSSPEPHEDSEMWFIKKQKSTLTERAKGLEEAKPEWAAPSSQKFCGVPIISAPSVSEAAGKEKFEIPVFSQPTSTGRLADCFVFKGA